MEKGKAKQLTRTRRLTYAIACLTSSGLILWALIHMAIAAPLHALAAAVGALIIAAARMDMLLLTVSPAAARSSAAGAHTHDA